MLDVQHDSLDTDQLDLFIYLEWFWLYLLFMLLFIYLCYCCIYCIYIDALATLCYAVMLIKLIWIELNWIEIELREREREREGAHVKPRLCVRPSSWLRLSSHLHFSFSRPSICPCVRCSICIYLSVIIVKLLRTFAFLHSEREKHEHLCIKL